MSKKKKKYYTIWKGHHPGIFESWDDCKAQIKNFEGAQYKSFDTFEAAKQAKTRESRIEQYRHRILMGKGINDCICGLSIRMPNCDGSHKFA